ncbi:MAG TPA: RodZ domain-containing protein [Candidatus Sulfotelmatobacter sp.]|jgi:cytoskeletal protein RodZ|nr:RodZ domain-containing protein [Candidatus Sulfotelmatobacter sp.]
MSSTPFGEHLKREREMRGVSLEEVSAATRISTRFLEAIESDRWESLPGGVFNRGFIRSVARYLGLDEDSMVAEYALETRGRVEAGVVPDPPMEMPRNWKPAIVATLVLVVILTGVGFAYARYGGKIAARLHWKPVAAGPESSGPPGDAARGAKDAAASAGAAAADPLELTLQTSKIVDVTIVADGATVFNGPIDAGDKRQFEARDVFEVTSSDALAIVLELNGQHVGAFGQLGLPGSIKLTRNDLKAPAGDSH